MKYLILTLFSIVLIAGCNTPTEHTEGATKYECPMKCEGDKTYSEKGSCPVCKMDLEEVK